MSLMPTLIRALRSAIFPTLFWTALIFFTYYATVQISPG